MKSERGKSILNNKLVIGLFIWVLVFTSFFGFNALEANADSFDTVRSGFSTVLCPRETGVFTDVVTNLDSVSREFTITNKGSSSAWASTVPNGFILAPGESKTIYTYATPFQKTIPSSYDLIVTVTSGGVNKELVHQVVVKKCYGSTLSADQFIMRSCPKDLVKYKLSITNNGEYKDSFILSADGQLKDSVTLSDKIVTLERGESKTIYAYVNSPSNDGSYGFNVKSIGNVGKQLDNFDAVLNVDPCYNFAVSIAGNNSYSFCERTLLTIPIKVENQGTVENTFSADVSGPKWARFDKNKFVLGPGQKTYANLLVAPTYGVNGDFDAHASIVPEKGDFKANTDFNFNVRKCNSVNALFLEPEVTVCNGLEKSFDAVVTNDGEVSKQYSFNYGAPEWVTANLDKNNLIALAPGEQKKIRFTARPGEGVNSSLTKVTLNVAAVDESRETAQASSTLTIDNLLPLECYKPSISTQFDELTVYYDSAINLPLSIKNEGSSEVSYDLVLSGTASGFVKLVPGVMTVGPDKSETAYLYVAPTPHLALGQYDAIISLKLPEGSFLVTRRIPITITDDKSRATSLGLVDTNLETFELSDHVSLWTRLKRWTSSKWDALFHKSEPVQEDDAISNYLNEEASVDSVISDVESVDASLDSASVVEDSELAADNQVSSENPNVSPETKEQVGKIKSFLSSYKYHTLAVLIVLLVLLLLIRLGFFKKLDDFLNEDEE